MTESVTNAALRWTPLIYSTDTYAVNNLNQYTTITPAGGPAANITHDLNSKVV